MVGVARPAGRAGLPSLAVVHAPLDVAIHVECEDDEVIADVAGRINSAIGDGDRGVPVADSLGRPKELWPRLGPLLQEGGFVGDAVAVGTAEVRPTCGFGGEQLRTGSGK